VRSAEADAVSVLKGTAAAALPQRAAAASRAWASSARPGI